MACYIVSVIVKGKSAFTGGMIMDKWLETRQLPVHFVSAAGLVYKDDKVNLKKRMGNTRWCSRAG